MRIAMFYHSLLSDWNHGNAHFLRGVASELQARGHDVVVHEPFENWSLRNLMIEPGPDTLQMMRRRYPSLVSRFYDPKKLDLEQMLKRVDLVIAHEWNEPQVIRALGKYRRDHSRCLLLFHDTHHRVASDPDSIANLDLRRYDGVLAFGNAVRDFYVRNAGPRAWTWHEAADVRVFRPIPRRRTEDLVWIGNWGDNERSRELHEFLLGPVRQLKIKAIAYGVRYPQDGLDALDCSGIRYAGYLPNFQVPDAFAKAKLTIHVPRRFYANMLPGIPTIRPFEAMACGIPLVSAPWDDVEGLFTPGCDYWLAHDGPEMRRNVKTLLAKPAVAKRLAEHGLSTILARHTCRHRVDQLMEICRHLGLNGRLCRKGGAS